MIVFRLEHTLYMQYDKVFCPFMEDWTLDETFGIEGNDFIFPLENGEFQGYTIKANACAKLQFSAEQRKILHDENAVEWKDERIETQVCRFLLMLVRRNNEIAPYADDYMISVLQRKLNQNLEDAGLVLEVGHEDIAVPVEGADSGEEHASEAAKPEIRLFPIFRLHGDEISMEQFFLRIAMTSEKITQPIIQYVAAPVEKAPAGETEAAKPESVSAAEPAVEPQPVEEKPAEVMPEKAAAEKTEAPAAPEIPDEIAASERDHFVKAVTLFKKVTGEEEPGSEKYNSICFNLGELMYCRDDLTCAAYFYKMCKLELLENKDDFYERLGHCYLDNKMNAFSAPLKLYFRAEQNEDFRKSHAKQLEALKISPAEIEKYRKMCVKIGKEKYN